MNKIEKQTPADLFVMIPMIKQVSKDKQETTFTLLKCAKMPEFEGVLPTLEILQTHFYTQRVKMEMAKRDKVEYMPQPLYIEIENSTFAKLARAVGKKQPRFQLMSNGYICLTLGNNMPCCIMLPQKEEAKEVCDEPLKEK